LVERILFARIEVWIVLALLIIAVPIVMLFGWAVQSNAKGETSGGIVGDLVMAIAEAPDPLVQLALSRKPIRSTMQPQLLTFGDFDGLRRYDADFYDDGILLVSAYSSDAKVSTVYLYDVQNQAVLHEWVPPVDDINAITRSFGKKENIRRNYRAQHPLLLGNGDLLLTSGMGPLVRISACGELVWAIDLRFHHSINMTSNNTVLVPIVFDSRKVDRVAWPIRNAGWAEVYLVGNIIGDWWVPVFLEHNGFGCLLHVFGNFESDRIHLNDAEPILETDDFVQEGDVVLSARHLSTVFLYRPSTDKVIWLSTGPWLNQHDVDYLGDGQFSVFDNSIVRGSVKEKRLTGGSKIRRFDMKSGRASILRDMTDVGISTRTNGLHRVLENGDIFVEETNRGLLHRVSADGLRWSYARSGGDGVIGITHWSRYLTKDEAQFPWLDQLNCTN
jgi:hypothetical protein